MVMARVGTVWATPDPHGNLGGAQYPGAESRIVHCGLGVRVRIAQHNFYSVVDTHGQKWKKNAFRNFFFFASFSSTFSPTSSDT